MKSVLDGKELTTEPVAINVVDGEEHVVTTMRSMKDPKTMEVVAALKQERASIRTTCGEFGVMGAGFILPKGYKVNEIVRFLYNILLESKVVVLAEIGLYKMGGDIDTKDKLMIGTKYDIDQMYE